MRGEASAIETTISRRYLGGSRNLYKRTYAIAVAAADGGTEIARLADLEFRIWPIRNRQEVMPARDDRLAVKYIPGAEGNLIVLRTESSYYIQYRLARLERFKSFVDKTPSSQIATRVYRNELAGFIQDFGELIDTIDLSDHENALQEIDAAHPQTDPTPAW